MYFSRRLFLYGAGSIACLSATTAFAQDGAVDAAPRTLKFLHTHTGEKLDICYARDGRYIRESLQQVNHLLRDFRADEAHNIDPALLDILFDLRAAANHDDAFEVISAYRSPKTNAQLRKKSIGVAENSLHKQGKAIDVRLAGYSTKKLHELALSLQRGGVGYYASSDFVHVDTGRVRSW